MDSSLPLLHDHLSIQPSSQFEELPCELIWMIIDYVPEAVFELRLVNSETLSDHQIQPFKKNLQTSAKFKGLIDKYALQRKTIPLGIVLGIHSSTVWTDVRGTYKSIALQVTIKVPSDKANLFELRFKLRSPIDCYGQFSREDISERDQWNSPPTSHVEEEWNSFMGYVSWICCSRY